MSQENHDPGRASYRRTDPSPRYRALLELYRQMHDAGDGERSAAETFDGRSLAPHTGTVRQLVSDSGARTLLDYGAGKGGFYTRRNLRDAQGQVFDSIRDYWNLEQITLYDPGYAPFSAYPVGSFDAVISTDVLEHIPAEDIPWILAEMAGFAEKFLFVTIAGYPAAKILPNGENAHCTLRPPEWWRAQLDSARIAAGRPGLPWFALYIERDPVSGAFRHTPLKG